MMALNASYLYIGHSTMMTMGLMILTFRKLIIALEVACPNINVRFNIPTAPAAGSA